jgi:bifunctional enzyme CysN/CysC
VDTAVAHRAELTRGHEWTGGTARSAQADYSARVGESIPSTISLAERRSALGFSGATVWLTGLPAAGKTTLAGALERALLAAGLPAYRLDGDEIRRELCRDLGFDRESRAENVRRVAHIARMLSEAGAITIVALVSPFEVDRQNARALHAAQGIPFLEVFLDTPIELCEQRDPKGLYAGARSGQVVGLTGVGGAYERPRDPDLRIEPGALETSVATICDAVAKLGVI